MRVEHEPKSSATDTRRVGPRTFVAALRQRLRVSALTALPTTRAVPPAPRPAKVISVTAWLRTARAEMDDAVQAREARAARSAAAHDARRERRREDGERTAASLPPAGGPESARASSFAPTPPRTLVPPVAPAPPARIEATLALVERVETFLRAGRPGLAFTLGGTLERSVELERVGPRRVLVSLRGGVFGQLESRQLAAELAARGITLARLERHPGAPGSTPGG